MAGKPMTELPTYTYDHREFRCDLACRIITKKISTIDFKRHFHRFKPVKLF